MISLDEVRKEVITAFQASHNLSHPDTLVNFPNWVVVDFERQTEPFVSLEFDLSGISQAALGERELQVRGILHVNFYYRTGKGTSDTLSYTDMLNQNLALTQVGAIRFDIAKPVPIQTFPGWEGVSNEIIFDIVPTMPC